MFRIGTDICSTRRIAEVLARQGERFLNKLFCPDELTLVRSTPEKARVALVAGRFAAKEAIAKALGTGIGKVSWQELCITRMPSGEPTVRLTGNALQIATDIGLHSWRISISHERNYAVAFVIAAKQPC